MEGTNLLRAGGASWLASLWPDGFPLSQVVFLDDLGPSPEGKLVAVTNARYTNIFHATRRTWYLV
jgi:hypothetical protein